MAQGNTEEQDKTHHKTQKINHEYQKVINLAINTKITKRKYPQNSDLNIHIILSAKQQESSVSSWITRIGVFDFYMRVCAVMRLKGLNAIFKDTEPAEV